jgi:uncharacterized protein (TIGR03086 family)
MFRAADLAGRVADAVPEGVGERPTPCTEWSIDDVRGHLVAVTARVAHIARGGFPADLPTLLGSEPEGGFAAAYATGVAGVREAWGDPAVLGAIVHHPAGDMPGAAAAMIYAQEFATHAVDLAVAIGRTDLLDEELLGEVLEIALRFVPAERQGFPFDPPVEAPADAPVHVRLAAWLGRDVAGTGTGAGAETRAGTQV